MRRIFTCLTDADIELMGRPALWRSLVAKAESGFDLVSVMVRLRAESMAKKFLIPAFVFFFFKLYPPAWVASNRGTAAAAKRMHVDQGRDAETDRRYKVSDRP